MKMWDGYIGMMWLYLVWDGYIDSFDNSVLGRPLMSLATMASKFTVSAEAELLETLFGSG